MGAFSIDHLLYGAVAGLVGSIAFLFVARKKYQESSRDAASYSAEALSVIEPIKDLDGPQPVKSAVPAEAPMLGTPATAAKTVEKTLLTPPPVAAAAATPTSGPKKLQPVTAAVPATATASDKTLVMPPPQAVPAAALKDSPGPSGPGAAAPAATPKPAPVPAPDPGPAPAAAVDKTPSGLKTGDTITGGISPAVVYLQNLKLQLEHLEKEVQTLKGQVSNVAQKHDTQFSAVLDRLTDLKTELHSLPHEFPPMFAAPGGPGESFRAAPAPAPKAVEAPPPILRAPPASVPAAKPVEAPAPAPILPPAPKPIESVALPPAPKPFEMPLVEATAPKPVLKDSPGPAGPGVVASAPAPATALKSVETTQPITPAPQPKPAPKPAEAPKAVPNEATIKLDLEAAIDAAIAVPPKGGAAAPKPAEAPKPVGLPKTPEPALKDSPGPSGPGAEAPAPKPVEAPKAALPTLNLDGPAGAGDSGERKPRRGPVWPV